ncbi:MAG: hypothetical protein NTX03_02615 [Bacteroidetes bacterium]|nr:hypothetical protein [Bacteroidota bacterium]
MNTTKGLFLFLAITSFGLSACMHDPHDLQDEKDTTTPVASITNPSEGDTLFLGDSVRVRALVTDNALHYTIAKITDDSTGLILFKKEPYSHEQTSVAFDSYWKIAGKIPFKATLTVAGEDHNKHVGSKSVHLVIVK